MVLGAAVGSETGKCQADKSARPPQTQTSTRAHGDISDLCGESGTPTNKLPTSSASLSLRALQFNF